MQVSPFNTNLFAMSPAGGNVLPLMGDGPNPAMRQVMEMMTAMMQSIAGGQQSAMFSAAPTFGSAMPDIGNPASSVGSFLGSPSASTPPGSGGGYTNASTPSSTAQTGNAGNDPVALARNYRDRDAISIRGVMPNFSAAGGRTNNCADFVSSALQSTGQMQGHEVGVRALEQRLLRQGWRQVPREQAGPGDVAFNPSRGHVQLCTGQNTQIGSNNIRPGFQRITEGRMGRNMVIYRRA